MERVTRTKTIYLGLLLTLPACGGGKVSRYDTMPPVDLGVTEASPGDGPVADKAAAVDSRPKADVKAGDGKPACVNECPAKGFKGCRAGAVVTCGQHDKDPCLDWSKASPCSKTLGPTTCNGNALYRQLTACVSGQCKPVKLQAPCAYGCVGGGCKAPPAATGGVMVTLWRWFSAKVPNHLTSNDINETPAGATFQGPGFYVPAASAPGRQAFYRLHRKATGDHMDSNSKTEGASSGYVYEGTLGYPLKQTFVGAAELRRWKHLKGLDHMLGFSHEDTAAMGYQKEVLHGHGYPRFGTATANLTTVSAAGVGISANRVAGGAIWSLTHKGTQYINRHDYGRLLQVVLSLSSTYGADMPTEAGSRWSGPGYPGKQQGSPALSLAVSGGILKTAARPLQWDPAKHGGDKNKPVVWGGFVGKEVEPNFLGMGAVVRWTAVIRLPKAVKYGEVELATAALVKELSRFWAYDAASGKLAEVTKQVPSASCLSPAKDPRLQPKAGGVIISSPDEKRALGVFRAQGQRRFRLCQSTAGSGGESGAGYSRFSVLEQHPTGAAAGTFTWTAYLVVGTVKECQAAMDKLYAAGL